MGINYGNIQLLSSNNNKNVYNFIRVLRCLYCSVFSSNLTPRASVSPTDELLKTTFPQKLPRPF